MNITWYGDGCFLIKSNYPKKIILNPNEKYLTKCDFSSDMIFLFSSTNLDVKIPNIFLKSSTVINSVTTYEDEKVSIISHMSYKDDLNGLKRGENFIYTIYMDNIKIVHLGLLGDFPSDDIIEQIKNADLLFIPIGGNICISGAKATKLVNLLHPKLIIPMYYKSSTDKFYFDSLHSFIIKQKNVVKLNTPTFHLLDLSKYTLNTTLVFDEI